VKDLSAVKVQHTLRDPAKSRLQKYRELVIGEAGWWPLLRYELICGLVGGMPGALGIWLRGRLYRRILGSVGRGVVFGRNLTFRHPRKIHLGDGVVIDELCMLDAKGFSNGGITLDEGVFVGRNSILVCKDGDIHIERGVNISFFCEIFSSNQVTVGAKTLIAAFCYLMSGGSYDLESAIPMADQEQFASVGPLEIGPGCWLGAKTVVLDGASIGAGSVIGAGAVVNRPIPARSVAVGIPARVVRSIGTSCREGGVKGVYGTCGSG
jgi:acetyltransferase-like isoleucine patch superfamily enzyme